MANVIDGEGVAAEVRAGLEGPIATLEASDQTPTLATVLMSDDPASQTYVELKQQDCEELGILTRDVSVDPSASPERLHTVIDELSADPDVDGILVQLPLPDHVDERAALRRIDPAKDVDGFHPSNLGRLLAGDPRFVPCTPAGIRRLLSAAEAEIQGADVVIVGRGLVVGRPLSVLLSARGPDADATVTLCHSKTESLAEKTRAADILVVAAGIPEFIDGSMVSEGVTVIDVGVNRVETDDGDDTALVGDVAFEAVAPYADAITPVPGGVGPMTRAMLLHNTVQAAAGRAEIDVEPPE
ncbi:MAG: bifunctional 5,10-methylenetetrahydrofolate dehydrogenase/5,10-methenyltetrahydrofolate cyclohydrolase [Halobacteriaceae archaeon]